ncbi:MAG: hypothetical protein ABII01_07315 [Candidatus Woesearchaeota archaeon]
MSIRLSILLIVFSLIWIVFSGCAENIDCEPPYLLRPDSCCEDHDRDFICDDVENYATTTTTLPVTTTTSTTLRQTTTTITTITTLPDASTTTTTTTIPLVRLVYETQPTYTLADYPEPFIVNNRYDGIIVVSSGGTDNNVIANDMITAGELINGLKASGSGSTVRVGSTILDSELTESVLETENIISIGNPCSNSITALIMDVPFNTCNDYSVIPNRRGIVKLYEYQGKVHIVVAGWDPMDTRTAARVLVNYRLHDLSGNYHEVD